MRNIILAVTAFTLIGPARAVAQGAQWVTPGAKIRVTAPTLGLDAQVGRVRETRGDTLVLETDVMRGGHLRADTVHVAMPMVTKLDVRTGGRGHAIQGAGLGFLLGFVIGVASGDDPPGGFMETRIDAGGKAMLGGIGLGLIGAGVGAFIKSDKWSEVPLDRVRPRLVAQQNGVGVGVVLRF